MSRVTVDAWQCDECGHRWLPEGKQKPLRCPSRKCRSVKWDKKEGRPKPKQLAKPAQMKNEPANENAGPSSQFWKAGATGARVCVKHGLRYCQECPQ